MSSDSELVVMKLHFEREGGAEWEQLRVNFLNEAIAAGLIVFDPCRDTWKQAGRISKKHVAKCPICKARKYALMGWTITRLRVRSDVVDRLKQDLAGIGFFQAPGQARMMAASS